MDSSFHVDRKSIQSHPILENVRALCPTGPTQPEPPHRAPLAGYVRADGLLPPAPLPLRAKWRDAGPANALGPLQPLPPPGGEVTRSNGGGSSLEERSQRGAQWVLGTKFAFPPLHASTSGYESFDLF